KKNSAGNPILDYRNKLDDKNLVIYGHNRKDGSMFGSLKNVLNSNWRKGNNKITWTTKEGTYTYQVFSTYIRKAENYFNKTSFGSDFHSFLATIKARSNYNFKVKVEDSDTLLTLSTCYGMSSSNKRLVVHAKLIK
ncbi:class B sortase, partial [Treponema sp. R6D11]